jgi:hypothetical protein
MNGRIGRDRLSKILEQLIPNDHLVLRRLEEHRFLQTKQVARFEFRDRISSVASIRAAHRTLRRLHTLGLVEMLQRTVGGAVRGSTAAAWGLTNTGIRMANYPDEDRARRRETEPTLLFLQHEIAVAELHLALIDAASPPTELASIETEPDCWRRYLSPFGAVATLKPDLAATVVGVDFESHYYFEVDRAIERPHRLIAKSLQYQESYRSGSEEKRTGVLPIIVWVVPDEPRRQQLFRHLTAENMIDVRLYRVLLLHEIEQLVDEDETVGLLPGSSSVEGRRS